MAKDWWDADGKFAPLHKFNPVRVAFIRDQIIKAFAPMNRKMPWHYPISLKNAPT